MSTRNTRSGDLGDEPILYPGGFSSSWLGPPLSEDTGHIRGMEKIWTGGRQEKVPLNRQGEVRERPNRTHC